MVSYRLIMRSFLFTFLIVLSLNLKAQKLSVQDSLLLYHPIELKPELEMAMRNDPGIESFGLLLEAVVNIGQYFYADSIYDRYFDSLTFGKEVGEYPNLLLTAARLNKIQQRNNLALNQYRRVLEYYQSIGDWQGEGKVIAKLGEFYRSSTQYEDGIAILETLIADPRFELLSKRTKAAAYHRLAANYNEGTQDFESSIEASRRSLFYSEPENALDQMATSYLEIGYTYYNRKDSRCLNYFRKAMQVWEKLGYGHYIANAHLNMASYFVDADQIDSAQFHLSRAMTVATNHRLPGFFALLLSRLSEVYYAQGDYKRAFELRDSAAELRLQDVRIQFDMDLRESVKKYQYDLTLSKLKTAEQERQLISEQAASDKRSNQFLLVSLISMSVISLLMIYLYRQVRQGHNQLKKQSHIISKQNEELSNTLSQKEILLKEVHHRVKNNLQMIISLLEMQELDAGDSVISVAIQDSILRRVSAMALVHEYLYNQRDLEFLQADEYLAQLVAQVRELSDSRKLGVRYKLELDACSLSIEKSVALGMIVSELLSNSYKYAFPPRFKGQPEIELKLKQAADDDNFFRFYYADNGVGVPHDAEHGLGSRLVLIFAKQLEAEVDIIGDDQGYKLHLKFYRNFEK